ncbi:MAG: hypothetical protein KJ614_09200 [Gammaproteobacteria bacterium]|uniref:hypothetical protein n=1 Tax=Rhodoferax sp. TaxID=50421 RepID=UPI0017938BB9|nr:hypothetical protein [Rhodoferax sp.]MBU3899087.1 hypothetical protein [Gammaproteobacteria bacterium]MBA3057613.1 hypothetical protein [Rhodoferax sp.]MBU3997647.1 hypothetical protein [Gammaproteobacteria bacterium]MBU4018531.1 hypothetical protein [Gammaproteobacteria bacterium]MBU4080543.1 hypothetical protein [Gammaproteobacteria bacterium]
MTICPIAIAVGCKKCPIFKVCPVKSVIGDVPKAGAKPAAKVVAKSVAKPAAKVVAKSAPARKKTRK